MESAHVVAQVLRRHPEYNSNKKSKGTAWTDIAESLISLSQVEVVKNQETQTHQYVRDFSQQAGESEECMAALQQENGELKAKLDLQTFSVKTR